MSYIGRLLQDARKKAGLSKSEAGRAVGHDYQRWHAWETGRSMPRMSVDVILEIMERKSLRNDAIRRHEKGTS